MMNRPSYLVQPNIQRLPNLLRDVQEGEIRIPRFQRPFVWTAEQRLLLVQSIYEGMPIGSILIWRTLSHDLACYEKIGPLTLNGSGRKEAEGTARQYLLDGHQRVTALYVALGAGLLPGDSAPEPQTQSQNEQLDEVWPIFFDLEERTFRVHPQRGGPPETWLPLSILLDPYRLYEFQKQLLDRGVERSLVNRAESLASTFKDYNIPVVPIVTESLEIATESFQRVNSGGTPMNEVHMVSALTWTPGFDLNERMREIRIELGEVGWESLDEKMILNTCKAALDLDIYYAETRSIRDALKSRPEVLREATESLKAAARFLRDHCKVYGPSTLPYSFQIVLLADALRQSPLHPQAAGALEKWFWLTTYAEYFAGISAVRLARALEHLRIVAAQGTDPAPPGITREVTGLRRFDFRTARSRAIALRMADLQARTLPNQEDPYQLLADHGRDAMPMLIPRREAGNTRLAEGPENRILVHPKEAVQRRREFRDPALIAPLDAFAISLSSAIALSRSDVDEFLFLRRIALSELEWEFVESLGLSYVSDRG